MALSSQSSTPSSLPFRGVQNDTSAFLPLDPRLREIRCIAILPEADGECITCELVYTNLEGNAVDRIAYIALSYCWGDVDDTVLVSLKCPSSKGPQKPTATPVSTSSFSVTAPFQVTRNLHTALMALRRLDASEYKGVRYYWIDAMCIDQSNDLEKTHQVGFMGKVFSSAESVFVWLGPGDIYSQIVCKMYENTLGPLLQRHFAHGEDRSYEHHAEWEDVASSLPCLLRQDRELSSLIATVLRADANASLLHDHIDDTSYWSAILISFDELLARSWWYRIWVLQEVALARRDDLGVLRVDFWMGERTLQWAAIGEIAQAIAELGMRTYSPHFAPFQYAELNFNNFTWFHISWWIPVLAMARKESRPTILDLMERTRHFGTTDPRDRFFALLHLACDTSEIFRKEPLICPDYNKPLNSVVEDYISWQKKQVRCFNVTVDARSMARTVKRHTPVTWSRSSNMSDFSDTQFLDHSQRRLCLDSLETPFVVNLSMCSEFRAPSLVPWKGRTLTMIEGPISQEIDFVQDKWTLKIPMMEIGALHYMKAHETVCKYAIESGQCRSAADYGFTQMFELGLLPPPPNWLQLFGTHITYSSATISERKDERTYKVQVDGNPRTLKKQRMFSARDGNMILGREDMLRGDIVVMLQGIDVPLALRPTAEDQYRVLGPCGALERYSKEHCSLDETFMLAEGLVIGFEDQLMPVTQTQLINQRSLLQVQAISRK